jgi:hypothetical protein
MEVQSFFFLLYYSNPLIDRVYIYVDGEERRTCMSHSKFIALIEETLGHKAIPSIKTSLLTHGTFWLLNRVTCKLDRVVLKGTDDLKNIQDLIQESLTKEQQNQKGTKEMHTGSVVEKYAEAAVNIPLSAEDSAFSPIITVK